MDSGMSLADVLFQSTLPMRGETAGVYYHQDEIIISIHSPHAGRDWMDQTYQAFQGNFNPLSPCGERRPA